MTVKWILSNKHIYNNKKNQCQIAKKKKNNKFIVH